MIAHTIKIECDERGFTITIDGDSVDPDYTAGEYTWRIEDPEALYETVKREIGPWLYERDQAKATVPLSRADEEDAYELSDPKHPRFHSTHVEIWDAREKGLV